MATTVAIPVVIAIQPRGSDESMFFHEEEMSTVDVLLKYEDRCPGERLVMTFAEGDKYACTFFTAFEDENDEDEGATTYDEFHSVVYSVVGVLKSGPNLTKESNGFLSLNYKHFPVLVTTENGEVVFKS